MIIPTSTPAQSRPLSVRRKGLLLVQSNPFAYDRSVPERRSSRLAPSLVCALVAGCGGSDADGLTKAEYIVQADRICTTQESTVTGIGGREIQLPAGGTARFNRQFAEQREAVLVDLEALSPPPDEEEAIDAWLGAKREQIDLLGQGAAAIKRGDNAEVADLTKQYVDARRRDRMAAEELGMKVCSQPAGDALPPARG